MNEITLTKKDKLLKEGYKLIYPNNLDLIMTMKNKDNKSVIIILDEKFKTKKEKAWIKKNKKKGDFTKNLESLIS